MTRAMRSGSPGCRSIVVVCDDVLASTGRKQEPFVYGSLPGEDFFFVSQRSAEPWHMS